MYSCASVGDASGGHSSIEGLARAHDEALVHLSAQVADTHGKDTTSDAPAKHTSRILDVSRCCRGRVDTALQQPKLDLPYKRMHPNPEGPARVSGGQWCQQLTNLAARCKSDGDGGRRLQQSRSKSS
jgi:hypothetical protein